jgi:hypothetical protein
MMAELKKDGAMSKAEKYINVRIGQLKEDMAKAHDPMDQAWYNRLIQELDWTRQMLAKPTHNCYMEMCNE